MAPVNTRISYLMDMLGISGKELALAIGTDTTAVSKWRSGQRKLKVRSKYSKRMAAYFISDAYALQKQRIVALLTNDQLETEDKTDQELIEMLSIWMTDDAGEIIVKREVVDRDQPEVSVEVYSGYPGWKRAVKIFGMRLLCCHQVRPFMWVILAMFNGIFSVQTRSGRWLVVSSERFERVIRL